MAHQIVATGQFSLSYSRVANGFTTALIITIRTKTGALTDESEPFATMGIIQGDPWSRQMASNSVEGVINSR